MRFALVDDKLVEAESKLKGLCPGCSQSVIAKCGTQKVHHWAHSVNKACDNWWEPETEWHRAWKSKFPRHWQEIFLPDKITGEKHMADVRADDGLVIEFQHSHIHPQERITRESFYKKMVWVVDGSRLKRDYPRFLKGGRYSESITEDLFQVEYPEECFPTAWLGSSVPVIFDFQEHEQAENLEDTLMPLYCLFPVKVGRHVVLAKVARESFVSNAMSGKWLERATDFTNKLRRMKQVIEEQTAIRQRQQDNINLQRFSRNLRYRNNRGRFRF
jgi:competence protein CoiA